MSNDKIAVLTRLLDYLRDIGVSAAVGEPVGDQIMVLPVCQSDRERVPKCFERYRIVVIGDPLPQATYLVDPAWQLGCPHSPIGPNPNRPDSQ